MAVEFCMPKNGMDMTEGTIVRWLKKEGDPVEKDEPIVEIETDKITMEAETPVSGVLLKRLYPDGAVVPVLTAIAYIGQPGEQLPEETAEHCRAAARAAMDIVCALAAAGLCLDETRIYAAALLHDVSKGTPGHALAGAGLMSQLGYPELAPLIAQHNDLEEPSRTDEAAVVFLADKLRRGAAPVRVTERFRESLSRCRDEEARRAHGRRLEAALESARRINDICGKDVVQI